MEDKFLAELVGEWKGAFFILVRIAKLLPVVVFPSDSSQGLCEHA